MYIFSKGSDFIKSVEYAIEEEYFNQKMNFIFQNYIIF